MTPDRPSFRNLARRTVTPTRLVIVLSLFAGLFVFVVASELFPYHSANHDEAVYLQQAAMLLDGKLWLTTTHPDAFQPWFFVRDGARLYPKYSPVPAAVFALGMALGEPRISLALVAAGNAALVALLAREAFDARTGVLTIVFLLASPLFVFTSSVFLPYAPTALFDFVFALCYIRAHRRRSLGYAVAAGTAIGIAFFARPYTAVLFAAPFVVHALWRLARALRSNERGRIRTAVARYVAIALPGLSFVGVALAYNSVVTGAALLFSYAAFAPLDGLGFGLRRILSHEVIYTPALALRANSHVLWEFATRWTAAGLIGTLLAGVGVAVTIARTAVVRLHDTADSQRTNRSRTALSDRHVRWLLVGVLVTVALGNIYFWGNLNILGTIENPTDGLIAQFGPYYHFDMLAPLSVFGATGTLWLSSQIKSIASARLSPRGVRAVLIVLVLVSAPVLAVVEQNAVGPPLAENRAYTERFQRAYEPFEERDLDRALVFVPTPYGGWLAHPFQSLRNGASLADDRVFALDRGGENLALLASSSNRTPYRYTYRGDWSAGPGGPGQVVAHLQRLRVRTGARHRITTTVGVPRGSESASVRIATEDGSVLYAVERPLGGSFRVEWTVTPRGARVVGDGFRALGDDATAPLAGTEEIVLTVTFVQPSGATVTYRQELAVAVENGRVRALWPPETAVCRLTTDCGHEGTYIPGADDYLPGVSVMTDIETAKTTSNTENATDRLSGVALRDTP